ncbi:hypothetical protein F4801DRAFT_215661 [Xylaria longipes]|nr:hypothetical protein F4801DRAFT_215661 [Xylaria longipes]
MPDSNIAVPSSREPLEDDKVDTARDSSSSRSSKSSRRRHSSSGEEDGIDDADCQERLEQCSTRHSAIGDAPIQPIDSVIEIPDEFYDRLPAHRKTIILILISFSAFLSPVSSTSVLAATPEVAEEYSTTGSIVNLVNALYLLFMGLSPIVWGPLSQVYGRRPVSARFTNKLGDNGVERQTGDIWRGALNGKHSTPTKRPFRFP